MDAGDNAEPVQQEKYAALNSSVLLEAVVEAQAEATPWAVLETSWAMRQAASFARINPNATEPQASAVTRLVPVWEHASMKPSAPTESISRSVRTKRIAREHKNAANPSTLEWAFVLQRDFVQGAETRMVKARSKEAKEKREAEKK